MGVFSKRNDVEEPGGGGSGLHVDLDERWCPQCRRSLLPWQDTCPTDGAQPVRSLPPAMPPPPAHLLADDDDAPPE